MTVNEIRNNPAAREEFLINLARQNMGRIVAIARNLAGRMITDDYAQNECAQAFLEGANTALDRFREEDDGRGRNSIEGWCKEKGLFGLQEFVRKEFGTTSRYVGKRKFLSSVVYAEDLYMKGQPIGSVPRLEGSLNSDPRDYAEAVVSHMTVKEFLATLKPIDRSILELLIFGEDEFGKTIRVNGKEYGAPPTPHVRTLAHVAKTLGLSEKWIQVRLSVIREIAKAARL